MEKKSYKSWIISDEFWKAVKEEIPVVILRQNRMKNTCKIYV